MLIKFYFISDKEKLILSMILYLSNETGSCFVSNKYIASIVNVTSDRGSKIISSLKKKQYIEVKLKYKLDSKEAENRQIVPNKEKINMYSQKHLRIKYDTKESWIYGLSRKCLTKYASDWYNANEMLKKCSKYNITYIDTSKNKEKVLKDTLEKIIKGVI